MKDHIHKPMPSRDTDFYFEDIIFLVEDRLFKVPRHLFLKHSEIFKDTLSIPVPEGEVPDGSSDDHPFSLDGLTIQEFTVLLKCLYPSGPLTPLTLQLEEWQSVLRLAKLYEMEEIAKLVIERMTPLLAAQPSLQVHLAKRYQITEWMLPGLIKLVQPDLSLNEKDVELLGLSDALKVVSLREESIRHSVTGESQNLSHQICMTFNFSLPTAAPTPARTKTAFTHMQKRARKGRCEST